LWHKKCRQLLIDKVSVGRKDYYNNSSSHPYDYSPKNIINDFSEFSVSLITVFFFFHSLSLIPTNEILKSISHLSRSLQEKGNCNIQLAHNQKAKQNWFENNGNFRLQPSMG
jgi:hypothetical protein